MEDRKLRLGKLTTEKWEEEEESKEVPSEAKLHGDERRGTENFGGQEYKKSYKVQRE